MYFIKTSFISVFIFFSYQVMAQSTHEFFFWPIDQYNQYPVSGVIAAPEGWTKTITKKGEMKDGVRWTKDDA